MTGRLAGWSAALVLISSSWIRQEAAAQATGQVSVEAKGLAQLEELRLRLRAPEQPRLNVFLTPELSHERFDEYAEDGTAPILQMTGDRELQDDLVESPEFSITALGATFGADYRFGTGWLLGGSVSYSHAEYDFATRSLAAAADELGLGDFFLGDPLDRSFDEYGINLGVGYTAGPWTLLLTGGYGRRENIETLRREFAAFNRMGTRQVAVNTSGDTQSDLYSVELGVGHRLTVGDVGSLQGLISIGYQREDVDGYTERFNSAFAREGPDDAFERIPQSDVISTVREFNAQTIESVPLEIGAVLSAPLGDPEAGGVIRIANLSFGLHYTHDFSRQDRTVTGRSLAAPAFSITYTETNRNRDSFAVVSALGIDVAFVRGTLTYRHDIGFDERTQADLVKLQLLVPF